MTTSITARITGDRQVVDRLTRLRRATRKATRKAANRALGELQKAIKAKAPRWAKPAVGKRLLKAVSPTEADGKVGIHVGKRKRSRGAGRGSGSGRDRTRGGEYANRAPHAHLIELGTRDRYTLKSRAYRGRVSPQPFVSRGASQGSARSRDSFRRTCEAELAKELAR